MIIRPEGERQALILQTDHADLSGRLARFWGGDPEARFAVARPFASAVIAAAHHDDGWAAWEAAPRSVDFVDVEIAEHLRLYRAGIARVAELDAYAGLLTSLHGVGLYNGRFGTMPRMVKTVGGADRDRVAAFLRDQEALQAGLRARLEDLGNPPGGPPPSEGFEGRMWHNYRLLQVFDRLSLYFCTQPLDRRAPTEVGPVPTRPGEPDTVLRLTALGAGRVAVDPYPFSVRPLTVALIVRRVRAGAPLPEAFAAAPVEAEAYSLQPA